MIVWLLENNRITSKERMLEVYLNIIEWGPGVYGATEASRYYFNKRPSDLSIAESIFLAMIVPRPKYFYWQFDDAGHLKKHTQSYFKHIATHMCRREVISEDEKNTITNDILLTGVAKDALKIKVDSLPSDSLQIMDDIIIEN
jgi:membrane peptidoglycan carboxypeptidase